MIPPVAVSEFLFFQPTNYAEGKCLSSMFLKVLSSMESDVVFLSLCSAMRQHNNRMSVCCQTMELVLAAPVCIETA